MRAWLNCRAGLRPTFQRATATIDHRRLFWLGRSLTLPATDRLDAESAANAE